MRSHGYGLWGVVGDGCWVRRYSAELEEPLRTTASRKTLESQFVPRSMCSNHLAFQSGEVEQS